MLIQSEGTTRSTCFNQLRARNNSDLWPEGLVPACWLVQQGLLMGNDRDAAAKSSSENSFSWPFSIPHSTVKNKWIQALRGSLSPHCVCCHEDFKLQRESVKVVQFCGVMAGSRDSHVMYHFLCWDTTACLCHAVSRLSHVFKKADFLCLLGKEIWKIVPNELKIVWERDFVWVKIWAEHHSVFLSVWSQN